MKTTYLVNKPQADGSVQLSIVEREEWRTVVKANKLLPIERRRYFILDYIKDGTDLDCIVIETSLEEYRAWDRSRSAERKNRRAGRVFQQLSLDAPLSDPEDSGTLLELVAAEDQVEAAACDIVLMYELKKALAMWKPWANELLELYLNGQKRTCTNILAKKYDVSPQVIRKYKRQFEAFIKKFLGGVSF